MSKLFSPIKMKNLKLKNRIVMPPMCMYSAKEDGLVTDWHYTHYHSRAVGGVGLIILEATSVLPVGRISDNDLGIWEDAQIQGLNKIVALCHQEGSKVGIQLNHAGRKAVNKSGIPLAPSPLAFSLEYKTPKEMSLDDIQIIVEAFGQGAKRAESAGFDTIEIHGAHGYLVNQFLSPLTNVRTDAYGGSKEHRFVFLKEIIIEIKKYWPSEKPIILRVSANEYAEGGNTLEEMFYFLKEAKMIGVDIINVSSGGVVSAQPLTFPGYQIELSHKIKENCDIPTIAGGLVTTYELAEEIVESGRGDMVFLGRELLRNPYWPINSSFSEAIEFQWPKQYDRSK